MQTAGLKHKMERVEASRRRVMYKMWVTCYVGFLYTTDDSSHYRKEMTATQEQI